MKSIEWSLAPMCISWSPGGRGGRPSAGMALPSPTTLLHLTKYTAGFIIGTSITISDHFEVHPKRRLEKLPTFQDHNAASTSDLGSGGSEQEVGGGGGDGAGVEDPHHPGVLPGQAAQGRGGSSPLQPPGPQLGRVVHVAVCGQMHGLVLWKVGCLKFEETMTLFCFVYK